MVHWNWKMHFSKIFENKLNAYLCSSSQWDLLISVYRSLLRINAEGSNNFVVALFLSLPTLHRINWFTFISLPLFYKLYKDKHLSHLKMSLNRNLSLTKMGGPQLLLKNSKLEAWRTCRYLTVSSCYYKLGYER